MSYIITPAEERAVDAVSLFDDQNAVFRSDVTREELVYLVRHVLDAAVCADAPEIAAVLAAHQRVVGPHGLTRHCTCGVDLGQSGSLPDHQSVVLSVTIVGQS